MNKPERLKIFGSQRIMNSRCWFDSRGSYHRAQGPAIEEDEGTKSWYWHGELRLVEWSNGRSNKFTHGFKTPPWRMAQEEESER